MVIQLDVEPVVVPVGVGDNKIRVSKIPTVLSDVSLKEMVHEFINDLQDAASIGESEIKGIDNQTHRRLAYLACRSAIKAGDQLAQSQIRSLMTQYQQTKSNYTCPHGRPVKAKISRREMEKWFRR